jgi:hypothetical protein
MSTKRNGTPEVVSRPQNTSTTRERVNQTRQKTRAVTHLLALRAGIETTCYNQTETHPHASHFLPDYHGVTPYGHDFCGKKKLAAAVKHAKCYDTTR